MCPWRAALRMFGVSAQQQPVGPTLRYGLHGSGCGQGWAVASNACRHSLQRLRACRCPGGAYKRCSAAVPHRIRTLAGPGSVAAPDLAGRVVGGCIGAAGGVVDCCWACVQAALTASRGSSWGERRGSSHQRVTVGLAIHTSAGSDQRQLVKSSGSSDRVQCLFRARRAAWWCWGWGEDLPCWRGDVVSALRLGFGRV